MPDTYLNTAAEIALAPFIAREEIAERVRVADADRRAAFSRGVRVAGVVEPQPVNPRTPDQIRAAAEVAAERAAAIAGDHSNSASARHAFRACGRLIGSMRAMARPTSRGSAAWSGRQKPRLMQLRAGSV